MQWNVNVGELT